ncbi:hypothetical protein AGLY_005289 [Aphis glycines]|uniref:Protein N-terminal asparagine amidohydrolase n=1 Tax=Aphis glycines TaxID=307491 RepID=A0A6G0TX76_APHGL|nr:hypothetical protein AGLY_005289 [Aphis glycines]
MVLLVRGVVQDEPPPDTRTLYLNHPVLRDSASQLLTISTKVVGPIGLLYVCQREMAVTVPHDKNVSIIGSDDVTTCIILVLRHTGSGAVGFAHLDGSCTEECVVNMVHRIQELSMGFPDGRLEMSLIGGFTHVLRYSEQVFYSLMVAVHKHQSEIELVLACVGELNTIMRNNVHWPLLYGAGVMVKSGEVFPANFPDKGPEQPLRLARLFTGLQPVLDVYDCSLGLLRIGPFNYEPMRSVDLWLQQSDEFILQALSTTPDVEPPHTVMAVRIE